MKKRYGAPRLYANALSPLKYDQNEYAYDILSILDRFDKQQPVLVKENLELLTGFSRHITGNVAIQTKHKLQNCLCHRE